MKRFALVLACLFLLPIGALAQSPERLPSFNQGDKVRLNAVDENGRPYSTALMPTLEQARHFLISYQRALEGGAPMSVAGVLSVGHNTLASFQKAILADDVKPSVQLALVKIMEGPLKGNDYWLPTRRLRYAAAPDPARQASARRGTSSLEKPPELRLSAGTGVFLYASLGDGSASFAFVRPQMEELQSGSNPNAPDRQFPIFPANTPARVLRRVIIGVEVGGGKAVDSECYEVEVTEGWLKGVRSWTFAMCVHQGKAAEPPSL